MLMYFSFEANNSYFDAYVFFFFLMLFLFDAFLFFPILHPQIPAEPKANCATRDPVLDYGYERSPSCFDWLSCGGEILAQ